MALLVGSGLWFGSTGNARGIFALGFDGSVYTPTTNIYTYANNGVVTGTNLTANTSEGAATGNSTLGIFAIGDNGSAYTPTTNVYTYSNNGVATGTNLTADLASGAAASSSPGGF